MFVWDVRSLEESCAATVSAAHAGTVCIIRAAAITAQTRISRFCFIAASIQKMGRAPYLTAARPIMGSCVKVYGGY